jgi:hypothetical protein
MLSILCWSKKAPVADRAGDDQALKGARIPGLLNVLDLFIEVFHVTPAAPHKCRPCAVNVAVEPDQSHALILQLLDPRKTGDGKACLASTISSP